MIGALRRAGEDPRVTAAGADAESADAARREALAERAAAIHGAPIKAPFTQADVDATYGKHNPALRAEAVADIELFGSNTSFDPDALVRLGIDALYRDPTKYLATTGLVIAGFGDNEYFPAYEEFSGPGFIGDRLFFERTGGEAISTEDSGFFTAFATTSMVDTFTMGFGPDVFRSVRRHLRTGLNEFAKKIGEETGVAATKLPNYIKEAIKSHTDKWTEDALEQHARPLRRVIGSLPIEEMASLAETLVMLESLKEKVTQPSESVSGPIDVAVITKHEGLIWAKRKHFFDPKLNPRYFWRKSAEYSAVQEEHR
jgi:hypothetical protein